MSDGPIQMATLFTFYYYQTSEQLIEQTNKHNTLEFRLDGTKINGENNTKQRHIVIKQEEKGVI